MQIANPIQRALVHGSNLYDRVRKETKHKSKENNFVNLLGNNKHDMGTTKIINNFQGISHKPSLGVNKTRLETDEKTIEISETSRKKEQSAKCKKDIDSENHIAYPMSTKGTQNTNNRATSAAKVKIYAIITLVGKRN
jgi:hypothetical protein